MEARIPELPTAVQISLTVQSMRDFLYGLWPSPAWSKHTVSLTIIPWRMVWKVRECNGQDTLLVFSNSHDPYDLQCTRCAPDSSFKVDLHELLKDDHVNFCHSDSLQSHFMSTVPLKGRQLTDSWIDLQYWPRVSESRQKRFLYSQFSESNCGFLIFCYQQPTGMKPFKV